VRMTPTSTPRPQGIHIVHVNMDGLINAPETSGAMMGQASPRAAASFSPPPPLLTPRARH
jgi:hypothetical protein